MHGISVSYPSGWKLQPATEPWTSGLVQGASRVDDPDWLSEILATVQLHPEDALDAVPSASPSAS